MHNIPFQERSKPLFIHSPGCHWQTKKVTPEVMVSVGSLQFPTTFVALKSTDIDIILGMNWLKKYSAVLNCADKSVKVTHPSGEVMHYWTDGSLAPSARYPLSPELQLFFTQDDYPPELHEVHVVSDFPDVFPKNCLACHLIEVWSLSLNWFLAPLLCPKDLIVWPQKSWLN